jgi:TonB family protein
MTPANGSRGATFPAAGSSETKRPFMPLTPTPIEPESTHEPESAQREMDAAAPAPSSVANPDAPVSFVPHEADGSTKKQIVKIRTGRFGELDEHELVRLLDTIEDERARGRFRESIYISVFFWMVVLWVMLYGPRYLWHAPKLIDPMSVLRDRQLTQLSSPVLRPHLAPRPAPKVDTHTLEKLRAAEPKPAPTPAPAPVASAPTPAPTPVAPTPLPSAPTPSRTPPPIVADAPLPQAPRPAFAPQGSASEQMRNALNGATHDRNNGLPAIGGGSRGGPGTGVDIISDTQGVNFNPYIQKILREIYEQWIPLIPEETRPPLSKTGSTLIRFTIMPDGRVAAMNLDGSTHDDAINKAAWGSINAVGQFPPLPKEFHGPNLELRIDFEIKKPEYGDR